MRLSSFATIFKSIIWSGTTMIPTNGNRKDFKIFCRDFQKTLDDEQSQTSAPLICKASLEALEKENITLAQRKAQTTRKGVG